MWQHSQSEQPRACYFRKEFLHHILTTQQQWEEYSDNEKADSSGLHEHSVDIMRACHRNKAHFFPGSQYTLLISTNDFYTGFQRNWVISTQIHQSWPCLANPKKSTKLTIFFYHFRLSNNPPLVITRCTDLTRSILENCLS